MTKDELKQKFKNAGVKPRDFIRWAAERGQRVDDATISRHLSGKQGITVPWALSYYCYFDSI